MLLVVIVKLILTEPGRAECDTTAYALEGAPLFVCFTAPSNFIAKLLYPFQEIGDKLVY